MLVMQRAMFAAGRRIANRPAPLTRAYATHKQLTFGADARTQLARGVDRLSRAVAVTLGPKGRHVLIDQSYGSPKITKDGVTVAKAITFENRIEQVGARLVQDVANKTNEVAGDGTTTATVLAKGFFNEGNKHVSAGCNPVELRKGVMQAISKVEKFLKEKSKVITTSDEIAQVATISANGDAAVGKLIAQAMEKVGKEGVITVQEGKTIDDELVITEGMRFDRGYLSPYFITDAKTQKIEFEKPYVLLCERKISVVNDIVPALEVAVTERRPLLIIAEDLEGEALAACILNKMRGQVQVAAVKAPGFGDNRKATLHDMAILTGGEVFTEDLDMKLTDLKAAHLGRVDSCTITKDDTVFLNGQGDKESIQERCDQLRQAIADTTSSYEKEKLQERLAKLSGGVAVIRVGGSSEVEVGEKNDRFVDALNATRAAVEEGVVPGGGVALLKASSVLSDVKGANFDQQLGVQLVAKALTLPTRTIVDNAGESGAYVVGKLLDHHSSDEEFNMGYDASAGKYVNMIDSGIVDPTKVVRSALVDAAGVSSLLTTSECVITDAPEKDSKETGAGGMPAGMGGMGGMGDY